MKNCPNCKIYKDFGEFYKNNSSKDGLHSYCKRCSYKLNKKWREKNKDLCREYTRKWRKENPEYDSKYIKEKRKTDIQYRLAGTVRSRLRTAIFHKFKAGSAVKNLGCSISELKSYLESKFQPGMSWDNWSRTGWHIDHIKPLASFDLTDPKQLEEACHYTNLQPLWAKENIVKSNKGVG